MHKFLQRYFGTRNDDVNLRERLRAVGIALLSSVTVGACQAIYFLLALPFVESSRDFKSISTLQAHLLTGNLIYCYLFFTYAYSIPHPCSCALSHSLPLKCPFTDPSFLRIV